LRQKPPALSWQVLGRQGQSANFKEELSRLPEVLADEVDAAGTEAASKSAVAPSR
jgi:hypothetical protein